MTRTKRRDIGRTILFIIVALLIVWVAYTFYSNRYSTRFGYTYGELYPSTVDVCAYNSYGPIPTLTSQECGLYYQGYSNALPHQTEMYYPGTYQTSMYYSPSPSPAQATLYYYGPQWLVYR